MAYTKKVWKDAPDTSTPINAANLNHMEDGIAEADVNAQNALDRLDDVDDEITQINSDLTDLTTILEKICTFTNVDNTSRWRCHIIPISNDLGLCVLKATLTPTSTSITYTIPKSTYGVDINAIMAGLSTVGNVAISLGQNGTAGEMFTGTRTGLTVNADYVIDTCYLVTI
jgi:hypothetical protein